MIDILRSLATSPFIKMVSNFIARTRVLSAAIAIVVIAGGYYGYQWIFPTATQTTYTLGTVTRGTVVATVSGSGQVSTSNKIDIKPRASGTVTWVAVKPGDTVSEGQLIAQIDNTDAKKAVIDAEQSLITSKLQFQKDTAQAPIDYQNAQDNLARAQDDLATTYEDIFSQLSNTYLDLPGAAAGMNSILYGYDVNSSRSLWNVDAIVNLIPNEADNATITTFANNAKKNYADARAKYDASIVAYKQLSRASNTSALEGSLADAITTTRAVANALQSEVNFLGEAVDLGQQRSLNIPQSVTTLQTSARNYLTTVNNDLTALLNQKKALDTAKQTITNDQNTISILKVGNADGANPISLQITANSIASAEANLAKLKRDLAEYSIVAPFDGTIASVPAVRGDSAPATVATIITNQKIAQLTLNEVDAAKVKLADKATLTFDAIDALTLTGKVSEIDTVGTVSQGVVSYAIKINFDTQDERIKSGMTVNASIQTNVAQDVLTVPSSAVKSQNNTHYVLMFTPPATADTGTNSITTTEVPTQIPVEIGISDDVAVEIQNGLTENQQVVIRSTTSTTKTTATTRTGGIGGPGIRL